MKLSTSSQCIKYLMFAFNLLFVITGIILLSIGSVIHGVYTDYQHFLDDKFFSIPSFLIGLGLIIFCIAFFGCCGAARESYCMIVTFASLMVFVFVLEVAAGISGYVLRAHAGDVIDTKMHESMSKYNTTDNGDVTILWDEVQKNFHCCGTTNSKDWEKVFNNTDLPMSCCKMSNGMIGQAICNAKSPNAYTDGCLPLFLAFAQSHAVELGGAAIGIAFFQALGIWFSVYLARSIRSSYETV